MRISSVARGAEVLRSDPAKAATILNDNPRDVGRVLGEAAATAAMATLDAGGTGCSFDADTPVATLDGQREIGALEVGDTVLAFNEATGMLEADPITHVWVNHDPAIEQLTLSGETLDTTPEHPFFTSERGWVAAGELLVGEHVRRLDGSWGVVEQLTIEARPVVMYNLTVARAHTFFVGDEGWLVHNTCGDGPRMRHYTSRSGSNGIEVSNTIKANAKQWESGCVYCERASGKPLRPRDAEKYYQLDRGHGRDYIEFDTFPGEARSVTNPRTGRTEWVVDGNIDLQGRNARITRR